MGGANAGDVASQTARDAIREFVIAAPARRWSRSALLEAAIQTACAAVFARGAGAIASATAWARPSSRASSSMRSTPIDRARRRQSRVPAARRPAAGADPRSHDRRGARRSRPAAAPRTPSAIPYKNVLSRNLGAKPETRVDLLELELKPGDRLHAVLRRALRLRVGRGDPVPARLRRCARARRARSDRSRAARRRRRQRLDDRDRGTARRRRASTQVVRTRGAIGVVAAPRSGSCRSRRSAGSRSNPICRGLEPDEALDLVALSLCEAIFHDLEKSTGVNVWTFAQNLAGGWFERGGDVGAAARADRHPRDGARTVIDEVRTTTRQLGFLLDVAVVARAGRRRARARRPARASGCARSTRDLIAAPRARSRRRSSRREPRRHDRRAVPRAADDPVPAPGSPGHELAAISAELVDRDRARRSTIARARIAPRAELASRS